MLSRRNLIIMSIVVLALALSVSATFAQSTISLDLDMDPLFTNINTYIPVFFGIFAIPGGIAIAIVLARFIINAVRGAFEGKSV